MITNFSDIFVTYLRRKKTKIATTVRETIFEIDNGDTLSNHVATIDEDNVEGTESVDDSRDTRVSTDKERCI